MKLKLQSSQNAISFKVWQTTIKLSLLASVFMASSWCLLLALKSVVSLLK